jgi:DNA-binding PadR family transcriptional regulator
VLTWLYPDPQQKSAVDAKYYQISECGRYTVVAVGSKTGRFTYEAWRGRFRLDGNLTRETAKLRCEHDQDTTSL